MSFTWYDLLVSVLNGINIFFLIYLVGYSSFMFCSVVVGSAELYQNRRQTLLKNVFSKDYYVPVSILVPAYNEEVTVVDTVRSLLSLDYPLYEIVVVDDGSKDSTSQQLIDTFQMHLVRRPIHRMIPCQEEEFTYQTSVKKVPITLIRKRNGGKADALNMGINACRYPYFVCMDADSVLQYDSLSKIVRPVLEQSDVVAVGGLVQPANSVRLKNGHVVKYQLPHNLLACMQVLEYDRSFLASRILFDKFNGSLIISGAFGLFKKDMVVAAGGYDHSTLGEDMELVVKLHEYCTANAIPYSIKYAPNAICWSQAPEGLFDLCKQRKRWHLGLFQTLMRHRRILTHPQHRLSCTLSYLYFLVFELLSPFIELLGLITMLSSLALGLINVPFMILFFAIYTLFGCVLTLTAFFARIQTIDLSIHWLDCLKALLLCFFEVCCLHFVMVFVRSTAFIGYKKKKMSWGRIERKKLDLQ